MLSTYSQAQLALLQSELLNDPTKQGYAGPIAAGAMNQLPPLLNATSGPGVDTVTMTTLTKDQALIALSPLALTLPGMSQALQAKWYPVLSLLGASTQLDLTQVNIQAMLAAAVADSLLTLAEAQAIGQRQGTRAEVVLGVGASPTWQDCAAALGLAQAQAMRDRAKPQKLGMTPTQSGMEAVEAKARTAGLYHGEHD